MALAENIQQIGANHKEFCAEYQEIIALTKTCVDNNELRNSKELDFNIMKTLPQELEPLIAKCGNLTVTEKDLQVSTEILSRLIEFKNNLKSVVDNIDGKNQREEEERKIQEQLRQQLLEEEKAVLVAQAAAAAQEAAAAQAAMVSEEELDQIDSSKTISKLSKYVVMTDLHRYTEIINYHQQYIASLSNADNDIRFKQLKFDFNKAVNTPLNSLSGVNAEHIMDKYRKLHGFHKINAPSLYQMINMANIFEDKFDERYARAVQRKSDQGLKKNQFIIAVSEGSSALQKSLKKDIDDPDIIQIAELLNSSVINPDEPRKWPSKNEHKRHPKVVTDKSSDTTEANNDKHIPNGQRKSLSSIYDTASRGSATSNYYYNDPPTSPNSSVSSKTSKTTDIIEALHLSPRISTRALLKILEMERKAKLEKAIRERQRKLEEKLKEIEERNKQELAIRQTLLREEMIKQQTRIMEANNTFVYSTGQAQIKQVTENAAERVRQSQEILKEKERQKQALAENIQQIGANHKEFCAEYQQIIALTKTCVDNNELRNSKELDFNIMKTLPLELEPLIAKCGNLTVTEKDLQVSTEILSRLIEFKNNLKSVVDNINGKKQREEEEEKIQEQLKQQLLEEEKAALVAQAAAAAQEAAAAQAAMVSEEKLDQIDSSKTISKLSKYVVMTDLHRYTEIINYHQQYIASLSNADNDIRFKQLKFDFNKAVNTPLNSLSGVNAGHIMDKYRKLHGLLSGQSVIVNNKQVNAATHPQGIPYCMDLLARKFVLQGDLIVSSNPESAFCYGSMILTLWNDFPEFGKLILGYFYKTCPYLVPYYIPKQEGDTDEEFYKKLGYQYNDGEVEKQDKFLKRMTGIMTLYFATMISKPKKGQSQCPLNLKDGWQWLASFLKLQPQLDITATALHTFLETVGFEMDARYGKVFQKVLRMISQVFLPKCEEAKCTGGAVTRLELLLNDYVKKREFPKPDGYVAQAYW